ncbi:MAG TPA: hypothetical protein VIH96_13805 [Paraburkholderia sp.]
MLVRISNHYACFAAQAGLRVVYKRLLRHCNNDLLIGKFKKKAKISLKGIGDMRRKYFLNFFISCPKVLTVYLHESRDDDKVMKRSARPIDAVNAPFLMIMGHALSVSFLKDRVWTRKSFIYDLRGYCCLKEKAS